MELLGNHTRNTYKDNYNIQQQFDLTKQITKEIQEKNDSYQLTNNLNTRELGIQLYQKLISKYNLSKHDLTELQLDELIGKYNISSSDQNIIGFVTELKKIIKTNIDNYENIGELYNSFNNDTTHSSTIDNPSFRDYLIHIDSNDRNMVKYPNSNNYKIIFGRKYNIMGGEDTNNDNGMIKRSFTNVEKIEILDVILLDDNNDTNNQPYLLLNIDELGNNLYGSNRFSSNSIAKLIHYKKLDNYKFFKLNVIKTFKPPIDINILSISLSKPNGELIDLIENSITIKLFTS